MSRDRRYALVLGHVVRVVLAVAGVGLLAVAGWAQDLPTVAISAEADEVTEGTPVTFTLTRSGVTEGAVTVAVAVSATDGLLLADTPPFRTEVVFADGETTRTLVLATVADRVEEADSVVTARLAPDPDDPVFVVESAQDAATVTVTDNDAAALTLLVDPSTVLEGGTVRVTAALVGEETFATDQTITLAFPTDATELARATKGDDYTVGSETLTLAAGARSVSTLVTTVDDAVEENLETIAITASHEGVPLVSEHDTIGILGNDDPTSTVPIIEIKPGPAPQEGSTAAFTLTRSGATTAALTVGVEVTATSAGVLSGAPPTTVQFESGRGSTVLEVATGDDAVIGPPGEITARVLLATDTSYAVSSLRSAATLRVDDNDLPAWAVILDTDPTPGLGNLAYEEAELWQPLSTIKPRWPGLVPNYGKAFMADGYLCLIRAFDGNNNPFWTLDEDNNPIPMKHKPEGIDVWDISDPRNPRRVRSWDDDRLREAHGLGLWNRDGQIVLVAQTHKGIAFYDVTSIGTRLELLAELDLPGVPGGDYRGAWWLAVQAPYVYVAAIGGGLHVVEARDPTAPRQVNHLPTGQLGGVSPASVSAVGNLLVLAETEMGRSYATLDISDPVHPVLIETIDGAGGYSHLFTAGRLFASGSVRDSPKMYVYDVGHDGRMRYAGEAGEGLGEGGYGSYQDGYFFSGFTKQVAKFSLDPPAMVGSGTSGLDGRDEDFANLFGNLIVASNDTGRANGVTALMPHQAAPDTSGPEVVWTHPPDGATNLALTSRVGVTLSDEVAVESLTPARFRVTRPDGSVVAGQLSVNQTVVNFTPDTPLAAATTYTVAVCRLKDLAGNASGCEEWTFSTRAAAAAPPTCRLDRLKPIETDTATTYAPTATTNTPTTYTWDFGTGDPVGPQATATAPFMYTEAGRYPVVLQVANAEGTSQCSAVQIVHAPVTVTAPVSSSSIIATTTVVSSVSGRNEFDMYVANPDNDTITRLFWDNTKVWEVEVGTNPRTLAEAPDGTIWVANQGSGSISVLSRQGAVVRTIDLGYGAAPYGIVFAPNESAAYVTLTGRGRLLKLHPTTGATVTSLDLGGQPRGIAVSGDSTRIFVTRFVSAFAESDGIGTDDAIGEVYEVDAAAFTVTRTLTLAFDPGPDTESSGRGVPNYLSQVRIAPDGRSAWVPSKKDNIARGESRDGLDLDFESQTRTIVSQLDLTTNAEVLDRRIDFNDRDLAQALVFTPVGDAFIVAFTGSNVLEVWDVAARTRLSEVPVGRAPIGLALRPDGRRLYVHNFLDRSVTVLNTAGLLDGTINQPPVVTTISTVEAEVLAPAVLRGKRIFYNAADPRMSQDSYISCASCHLDGGADGMVWDRTQTGEGLRNTIDLRGRRGTNGGLVHWSGNFDEIQDFEHGIRDLFGGTGFMTNSAFETGTRNQPLGDAKTGFSNDLDDLAAYVESLDTYPPSPYRQAGGGLTAAGRAGRAVFMEKNCARCHVGQDFTDDQLHDVGTITASSGQGNGMTLSGINTPTLQGLWLSAPYLHDGSATTLADVLDNATHMGDALATQEKADLAAYLMQIDETDENDPPEVRVPAIVSVALTSTPSIDTDGDRVPETYGAGETIEVTVTWDADVLWDVSAAGAAIKLDLDIGGHTKRISMVADTTSGTARALVFRYVVRSADTAPDGVFPKPWGNSLVLLTHGATLTGADGRRPAWRVHVALAPDPAHQVDGGRLPSGAPNPEMPALPAPAIVSVALTSTPSIDADGDRVPETYGAGETIEVTVTWDADVLWDVSAAGAAIKLDLDIGGHTKRISMVADTTSGTARALVFQYVVQRADRAPGGVFPKPWGNSLVLLTHGATLTGADGVRPAWRVHAALVADPGHKVNGGPPEATPDPQVPARAAIVSVALTSTPQIDVDGDSVAETYGVGETIEVTVTWDADVLWDVSAPDAAIKLDLDIGGHTKRISIVADGTSGTTRALVFHYVVRSADTAPDGIFPKPWGNNLVLLTRGATLTSADGVWNARRAHAALAPDPMHTVDGSVAPSNPSNPQRARATAAGAGAHGERRAADAPALAFLAGAAQERRVEPHRSAGFPIGTPVAATGADPLAWSLDDAAGLFAIDPDTGQLRLAVDGEDNFEVLADGSFRRHGDLSTGYLSIVFDLTVLVTDSLGRDIETAVAIRVTADTPGDVTLSTYAPVVGQAMTASVSDPDGVLPDSVRWQWEVDDGEWREDDAGWFVPDWQVVAGATGATFTPSAALAGSAVRAVVSYADGLSGPDEPAKQATSASTDDIQ